MEEVLLKEYRCPDCGKLLFKGDIHVAVIEIKCKRCKKISVITGKGNEYAPAIALPPSDMASESAKVT